MQHKSLIIVKGQFEHQHRYYEAPEEVSYLRSLHRHLFHYEVELEVFHDDRELEFIMVKHRIDAFVERSKDSWGDLVSCEQMALAIGNYLRNKYGFDRALTVSVLEDNENGAKIIL